MKVHAYQILVLLGFLLTSCSEIGYEPIEGKIAFSSVMSVKTSDYHAKGHPDNYSVMLGFNTDKIYKCTGKIVANSSTYPGHIEIDIKGVELDKDCLWGSGPATIGLVTKLSDGIYDMDISYRGNKDTYSVNKEGFKISITQQDATFSYYRQESVNSYRVK